ncbi:MAG: type II secretion system protein [Lentisphaerae bacterium]|nr:type II secretion system protein [Lentisphaerota bacterium]MCP4103545.1 type II secretion system protein [Lentisphaerota bacterium]
MKLTSSANQGVKVRHFSLVEMLVVMAIIAVLLAMGAGSYQVARRALSKSRTEALLTKVKLALESYKSKHGYYPLKDGHITNNNYKQHEEGVPFFLDYDATKPNFNKFIDVGKIKKDESVDLDGTFYLKDGWNGNNSEANVGDEAEKKIKKMKTEGKPGGLILYRCPGGKSPQSFDLYSAGNDRELGTDDDIYAK